MSERTIGVAIGLPEPVAGELREWRETFGDPLARAVPPHITLVPPTVVDDAELPRIEAHLDEVAARHAPFEIQLRGTGSFLPVSPVVFVALATGISNCERLEADVRRGPLSRPLKFYYHPHVTVAHELTPEALDRAFTELADYRATFWVREFGLFEQDGDGVWHPQRAFTLRGESAPTAGK